MELNVNDILGKGFKFNLSAEQSQVVPQAGTSGAFIGCADWGPVGVPIAIGGGARQFQSIFGTEPESPESIVDMGYYSALKHFQVSANGYFTRIANETSGNLVKAKATLSTGNTFGRAVGNVVHSSSAIDTNAGGNLEITLGNASPIIVNVAIPESVKPEIVSQSAFATSTFATGNALALSVVINGASPVTGSLVLESGTFASTTVGLDALKTALEGALASEPALDAILEIIGGGSVGFVGITTKGASASGSDTSIQVVTRNGGFTNIFAVGTDFGVSVPKSQIASVINNAVNLSLGTNGLFYARFNSNNFLEITDVSKNGTESKVVVGSSSIATLLLGTIAYTDGEVGIEIGEIEATYFGRLGNTISVETFGSVSVGNKADIYFNGRLLSSIVNFSYNPSAQNYIGSLINNDIFLQPYVTYNQITANYTLEFGDGVEFKATGGRSGGFHIFPASSPYDAEDEVYPSENYVAQRIRELSNVDVFNIDFISYPAYGASHSFKQSTQDVLQEVCETRQDCFAFIDPPFVTSVSEAVNWSNGVGGFSRTEPIDSMYLISVFPWLKLRVKDKVLNAPPSVELGAVVSNADRLNGVSFSSFAGKNRGRLSNSVVGLSLTLSEEDKVRLYADEYNGRLNPIAFSTASGFFVDGNKTTQLEKNALRRIDTMRVGLYLKKQFKLLSDEYFYLPSDDKTWASFTKDGEGIMRTLEELRKIEPQSDPENGWKVICDASVNTAEVTSKNGMVAKIEYCGINSIERIAIYANIKDKRVTISVVQ